MPTLAIHLAQTRYGTADALVALTVGGVARPDVLVKPTRDQAPHIERISGTWLPGSTVAVTLSLKNDLYEPNKGDRNAHLVKVELDGVDQKIARDVLGAAIVRFDVKVPAAAPAQPTPSSTNAPSAAEIAALAAKVDAAAARLKVVEATGAATLAEVQTMRAEFGAFLARVEIVDENGAPIAAE